MNNNRPKIQVPFQSIDIVLECISIALILIMWLLIIKEYSTLPETIASHFNANGEPDGYSNKTFIFLIPLIAIVMYLGLFILNRYPHIHNYMVNITEANALKNYRFSTKIVRVFNTLSMILFTYITYHIIESAKGQSLSMGSWYLPIVLGISVILPIWIIIYFRKINKN